MRVRRCFLYIWNRGFMLNIFCVGSLFKKSKDQELGTWEAGARFFEIGCLKVEDNSFLGWACCYFFLHPGFAITPPKPICLIFNPFWLFLFLFDLFIFSQHIKILKIIFSSFFDFIWYLFDFLLIYTYMYIYYYLG